MVYRRNEKDGIYEQDDFELEERVHNAPYPDIRPSSRPSTAGAYVQSSRPSSSHEQSTSAKLKSNSSKGARTSAIDEVLETSSFVSGGLSASQSNRRRSLHLKERSSSLSKSGEHRPDVSNNSSSLRLLKRQSVDIR